MRTSRLVLASLAVALSFASPAHASGSCVDTSPGNPVCTSPANCRAGDRVTVRVVGSGAGIARCGGVTAFCNTPGCVNTRIATQSGQLQCSIDPFQPATAVAYCEVPASVSR